MAQLSPVNTELGTIIINCSKPLSLGGFKLIANQNMCLSSLHLQLSGRKRSQRDEEEEGREA